MTVHAIATAGHVDHGKSTLVHALTGVDPDRLAEEKRRGLTIELGFARVDLGQAGSADLIDVPGHVRFLKTMLAGVGAVRAALLVVAATEGAMPQTDEHLAILDLLGIRHGLVVITMADRVDAARIRDVVEEVDRRRAGSFFERAVVAVTDAVSGRGIDELRGALAELVATIPPAEDRGRARLWVDRSFSRPGAGTVVTGTLIDGPLEVGDVVDVVGHGRVRRVQVRALESFGTPVDALAPGRRAAVALAGVAHRDVARGDALVSPGRWHVTDRVDVRLRVLDTAPRGVRSDGTYALHLGTIEQEVTARMLGDVTRLEPGEEGMVRLRLTTPVPLLPGDRYVLRDSGRASTLGGGEVLDVAPVLRPSRAQPDRSVERVVAERGWVEVEELDRLTGERRKPTVGRWVISSGALDALLEDIGARVDRAGGRGLDVAGLDARERAAIDGDPGLVLRAGRVHRRDAPDVFDTHPYLDQLASAPFHPPSPEDAGASMADVRELVRRGLAVREEGVVFSVDAVPRAAAVAADLLAGSPDGFSVAELRVRLGTSRRYTMALLARLDRDGVTRRRGGLRVAGPRLPSHQEGDGSPSTAESDGSGPFLL